MLPHRPITNKTLTLNISNALLKDLVEGLGVLELLLDLGNDALGKLLLLADLDLALVADPGVKDGLGLGGEGSLLLHLVGLGLELGGLLFWVLANVSFSSLPYLRIPGMTCLGDSEEVLGGLDDTTEVRDTADAALDGVGVVVTRSVQDVLDLVGVVLGELLVHGADIVVDTEVDGEEGEEDNGLLVDDVELVADGGDGKTSTGGENADLGGDAVTGKGVQDGLCGLLGLLLRDLGILLARGGGREGEGGRGGAEGEGRTGPDGAWEGVSTGNCARVVGNCW